MRTWHVLLCLLLVAVLGIAYEGYELRQADQQVEGATDTIRKLPADQLVTDRAVAGFVKSLSHAVLWIGPEFMDEDLVEEYLCEPVFKSTRYSPSRDPSKEPPTVCQAVFAVADVHTDQSSFLSNFKVAGTYTLLATGVMHFQRTLRYQMWSVLGCDPDVLWAFYQKKKPSIIKAFQALPAWQQTNFLENLKEFDKLVDLYRQPDFRKAINVTFSDHSLRSQAEPDVVHAAYERAAQRTGPYGVGGLARLYFSTNENDAMLDAYQRVARDLRATLTTSPLINHAPLLTQ